RPWRKSCGTRAPCPAAEFERLSRRHHRLRGNDLATTAGSEPADAHHHEGKEEEGSADPQGHGQQGEALDEFQAGLVLLVHDGYSPIMLKTLGAYRELRARASAAFRSTIGTSALPLSRYD